MYALLLVLLLSPSQGPPNPDANPKQAQQPAEADPRGTPTMPLVVKVEPSTQTTEQATKEETKERREIDAYRWTIRIGVGALILGLLQLVMIGIQAWIARVQGQTQDRQLQTAQTVERAYVGLSHHPPGIEPVSTVAATNPEERWRHRLSLRVKVTNNGNTPARITRSLIQFMATNLPLPDKPEYAESLAAPGYALLSKGDSFTITIPYEFTTTGDGSFAKAQKALAEQGHSLYVIGYVDYIDKFGGRHRSGYGRVYDPSIDDESLPEYQNPSRIPEGASVMTTRILSHRTAFDLSLYLKRSNLVLITKDGYNYDRKRVRGEGNDWDETTE